MNDRLKGAVKIRSKEKDIQKLLAALRLKDAYAMKKLMRRLVLGALALAVLVPAAPADAKKITDEELQAFLSGKPLPAAPVAKAAGESAAAVTASAPAQAITALTSAEGELKGAPAGLPASTAINAPSEEEVKKLKEIVRRQGQMVYDEKTKTRRFEAPDPLVIPKDKEPVAKKVRGTVGVKIKSGMSVTFDRDGGAATELWADFNNAMKLDRMKSLDEVQAGDEVEVEYRESKDQTMRVVTAVRLAKKMTAAERKRAAEQEAAEDAEGAMASGSES